MECQLVSEDPAGCAVPQLQHLTRNTADDAHARREQEGEGGGRGGRERGGLVTPGHEEAQEVADGSCRLLVLG